MSQYLQVRVADVHVLLPALQVHEVLGLDAGLTQTDVHVAWRDQVIGLMDLGELLERSPRTRRPYGVVYSFSDDEAEPVVMLQIDEVLGLRQPSEREWRPLPFVPSRAQTLFDAVWSESDGQRHSYRLRHPAALDKTASS